MDIIDMANKYSGYYSASTEPEIVEIGRMNYLSILGSGSPGTPIFYEKKKAIIDFLQQLQKEFTQKEKAFKSDIVEIFYWFDEKEGFVDIGDFYTTLSLDILKYRIAVVIPDFITAQNIEVTAENHKEIPFASQFETFDYNAGKCVQLMHLGPFAGELVTLPILQNFASESGLRKSGMHHEIHITYFEKGQSQANMQTILRDPVQAI